MCFAGNSKFGKIGTRIALIPVGPFRHRYHLATYYPHGFTAPDACVCKEGLVRGNFVYIGSNVLIFRQVDAGKVVIGDRVHLNDSVRFEAGAGGGIEIGEGTHIQPECQFSAYVGNITVGKNVQIAPRCAFYPYDHGISPDKSIMDQPLLTRGGILVKDEAWIGYGVIILDNVRIGVGAVVGAGSVVKEDIPDFAISAGIPAKIIKMRE